ncbi:hypothetical protein AVEN_213481-1 [Araneus ventricosus]|uniref:Uncharacterized protein n=1 Tax=Araneus ventricosus TaxID=182803 RepID=A0A4Y2CCU9_ARAVE|nr:hypothetical protein AVEN_62434-1 [Araneus ventricosus]GBM01671.1 hypothetical protein AVEN_149616-1 [Araneus ventricosus]GBM01682.1 hypothetical protein AVEN_186045-1 [Araneus ventricosus]GBM01687.1 hypothetical protein AVEN_213481-1 [Araneus ventricosus]
MQTASSCRYHAAEILDCSKGLSLAPSPLMAILIPHVEHQRSPISPSSLPETKILFFLVPKSCLFISPKILVLPLRQAHSLLYKNQMLCQALPSSLLPVPTVKLFSIGKA